MKTYLLIILGILFNFNISLGNSYTWKGNVDSVFTNSSNWISSSGGYPGSNDSVIIVTGTYHPVLDQNRDILHLTMTSGILDLKSYTFTVQSYAILNSGTIDNGTLTIRGISTKFNGTTVNSILDVESGVIEFNGGIFNNECHFKINGNSISSGTGGCVFNDDVVIIQHASRSKLLMATVNGDEFNGDLKLYITNDSHIYLSYYDSSAYNGNVYVNNTGSRGSILFGDNGGVSILATGKTISVGDSGYAVNNLYLSRFKQLGNTSQNIALTGSANLALKECIFNGTSTLSSPGILCSFSTFNSSANIFKTGPGTNYWYGNNLFYGTTTISNGGSGSATDVLRLSGVLGNKFYGNATFESNGKTLQVDNAGTSEFSGDIEINHSLITFKSNVELFGSINQSINGTASISFMNLTINKSSNNVTTNTPIEIVKFLTLESGNLITDSINLLTINANGNVLNASNSSFVSGPVKKFGNTLFKFPVGKDIYFTPLEITAPTLSTDAYTAEFFNNSQSYGDSLDASLNSISSCNYWSLTRNAGTSNVKVTLKWNSSSCSITYPSNMRVTNWDGIKWLNLGNEYYSGDLVGGYVRSSSTVSNYSAFSLGSISTTYTGAPILLFSSKYAILSKDSGECNLTAFATGKIGSQDSLYNIQATDSSLNYNSGSVSSAIDDLIQAIYYVNGLPSTNINSNLNDLVLSSGIYRIHGNANLNDSLNLNGDSTSIFIFQVDGSLNIDSAGKLILNGVRSNNIYWIVNNESFKHRYGNIQGIIIGKNKINFNAPSASFIALNSLSNIEISGDSVEFHEISFYSPEYQLFINRLLTDQCSGTFDGCNEILNSDFNLNLNFPTNFGQLRLLACNWDIPTPQNSTSPTTPDYYTNNPSPFVWMNSNFAGCQSDHSVTTSPSRGYAGIVNFIVGAREYFSQQLNSTLLLNQQYYAEMYISLAEKSDFSLDQLGMAFTQNNLSQWINNPILGVIPQIESPINVQLDDDQNWTRVSGCFTSTDDEAFVTIGNFRHGSTNFVPFSQTTGCTFSPTGADPDAYYYIDDPTIVKFEVKAIDNQTVACNATVTLGQATCINNLYSANDFTYSWVEVANPLGAILDDYAIFNPTVTFVNTTGSTVDQEYLVTLTSPDGCTTTDEVTISVLSCSPCDADFTNTPPCINVATVFTSVANDPSATFAWTFGDGSTNLLQNPSHIYTEPGYYEVTLTVSTTYCLDCFRKVIYVSPNCCAFDGTITFTQENVVPDEITSNTTWGTTYYINRAIYVKEDVILTIGAGTIIEFGPEGKIILERKDLSNTLSGTAARMIMLTNSKLTSITQTYTGCPVMWQGVEVWGHYNISHFAPATNQANHAKLIMNNGADIKNAHNGVVLGKTLFPFGDSCNPPPGNIKYPIYDLTYSGGILVADNSYNSFIANGVGVRMLPFSFSNASKINGCQFLGDILLDYFYQTNPPHSYTLSNNPNRNPWYGEANTDGRSCIGVYSWGTRDIVFTGNEFDNMQTGIETYDSQFQAVGNTFNNHYFGIDINNTITTSAYNVNIRNLNIFTNITGPSQGSCTSYFLDNAAIRIRAGRSNRIQAGNIFGDYSHPITSTQPNNTMGIHVIGSNNTKIVDNYFGDLTIGIITSGSFLTGGLIGYQTLGNQFYSIRRYGIFSWNNNPALKIRCNNWDTQTNTCISFNCWRNTSSVPLTQGSGGIFNANKKRAGNEFDWLFNISAHKYVVNSGNNFTYYHHIPSSQFPSVVPVNFQFMLSLGNPITGTLKLSTSCESIPQNYAELYQSKDSIISLKDSMNTLFEEFVENLDHGKTNELLEYINDSTMSSEILADSLILFSPLSNEVLVEYFERTYPVNDSDIFHVMIRNVPLDDIIFNNYSDRINTLSDTIFRDSLLSLFGYNPNYQTPYSFKREISKLNMEYSEIVGSIIDSLIEPDSTSQLIEFLWSEPELTQKMDAVGMAYATGNLNLANELLSGLTLTDSSDFHWASIMTLALELESQDLSWFSLDSIGLTIISNIATDSLESSAKQMARCIMKLIKGTEFEADEFIFEGESRYAAENNTPKDDTNKKLNQKLTLSPNPANSKVNVSFPSSMKSGLLKIYDISGRLLKYEIIDNYDNELTLDISTWNNGMYFVNYTVEQKYYSEKLIINHNH